MRWSSSRSPTWASCSRPRYRRAELGPLGRDVAIDFLFEHAQRHRAIAEHDLVKVANVELAAQRRFGPLAQLGDLALADHVARRLPRIVDVAIDLALDV